jgi:type III secretory pathway component EscS
LREGGKGIVLLSLAMASVVMPAVMGLIVNYVGTFTQQATVAAVTPYIWLMVAITSVALTLFGGVVAGDIARFASAAPSLLTITSIVFDAVSRIRLI